MKEQLSIEQVGREWLSEQSICFNYVSYIALVLFQAIVTKSWTYLMPPAEEATLT